MHCAPACQTAKLPTKQFGRVQFTNLPAGQFDFEYVQGL